MCWQGSTMGRRDLLRAQLWQAWNVAVHDYDGQRINTEGDLQFRFCLALERLFEDKLRHEHGSSRFHRKVYQLAALVTKEGRLLARPDVVVCDGFNRIIGIVELKYTPRVQPDVVKDIHSLRACLQGEVALSPERYRGPLEALGVHEVAPDAVVCWAGIYADQSVPRLIELEFHRELWPGAPLLTLHALTSASSKAEVSRLVLPQSLN